MSQGDANLPVGQMVGDSLTFMRENGAVFRKYLFLPCVLSIASLFAAELPVVGLALLTVGNALALALVGVSATRFYAYRDADQVAQGANRPFARFFFVVFILSAMSHIGQVFALLPNQFHGMAVGWVFFMIWLNLKLSLSLPAISLDHPASVAGILKLSLRWTNGQMLRIIFAVMICHSPLLFFSALMFNVGGIDPADPDFWSNMPFFIFSNILMIFSMMWSSLVLVKIYQGVVRTDTRA